MADQDSETTPDGSGVPLEESLTDLYEHAPCGYLTTSPDGMILRANATFLAWTGYEAADLVGAKRFVDLLSPGGRIYHETHYAPLLRMQGTVREIALDLVRADGTLLPALVNSVLMKGSTGQPAQVRTTVFDATDRREYEQELLRAMRRAEASEARAQALARTLQASLIPPAPPQIPGLDVAAVYRPSGSGEDVGGDFYDVFETAVDDWAVVIGDVCGKGVEAATVTVLARHTVRAAAIRARRPSAVLTTLNEALLRQETERFCTVAYARVRPDPGGAVRLSIGVGGHPLPLRAGADGPAEPLGRPGTLLGILDTADVHDDTAQLRPGDVVVFSTDGVTEARRDGEFFGDDRLAALVEKHRGETASGVAEHILGEVMTFQRGVARDDIALVVLKVPDRDASRS